MSRKNSFIMYTDTGTHFAILSNEDAGLLIKAIFSYADTGEEIELPASASMLFSVIRAQIDRDAARWEEERQKRTDAGKKGANKRWHGDTHE